MKTIFLITAFVFTALINVTAQKQLTEGKIVYAITLPDTGDMGMAAQMMGKEQVMYFKNGNVRMESKTIMGDIAVISDAKSGEGYSLMNMMGEKYAIKMTDVDLAAFTEMNGSAKPEVKVTKEQKKILGYKCTKAIVTYKSEGKSFEGEAWFTKDIAPISSPLASQTKVEGIDGFIVESSIVTKGMLIKVTCTKIETTPVSDELFKVPEGYTIKTMAELMGGMK